MPPEIQDSSKTYKDSFNKFPCNRFSIISAITIILILLFFIFPGTIDRGLSLQAESPISIAPGDVSQGELVKIELKEEVPGGEVVFAGESYSLHTYNGNGTALIPVSYWLEPGEYTLSIFSADGTPIDKLSLSVTEGNFSESFIEVDEEMEEQIDPEAPEKQKRRERDRELVYEARSDSSEDRLWQKSFRWPLEGRITTEFGATRYHNGELANRHNGIDIAAPQGTPVKSTNRGRVVLARDLLATGKTVIIDHGWNVFSSYLHFSELKASKGDMVEKGDVIGLVGETGFATGPHLHWSMSVKRVFVDPEDFLELDI